MGGAAPVAELVIQGLLLSGLVCRLLGCVVYEAKNLGTKSFSGRCNSLCAITFDNMVVHTQLVKNSTSPHWNEEFRLYVELATNVFVFTSHFLLPAVTFFTMLQKKLY